MAYRLEKVSSTLKHCLADILLNEINDLYLKQVLIINVLVSDDLKKARIFISSITGSVEDLLPKLEKAKGFLKKTLAKKMYLKYIPDLIFIKESDLEKQGRKDKVRKK